MKYFKTFIDNILNNKAINNLRIYSYNIFLIQINVYHFLTKFSCIENPIDKV